ncbi:GNAT family N-acetyltransferase [Streptomyces sp. NBC_00201]|uniref:GNAT family N-acetyltransferase n=1 Tax=unclassified Streptomyces TaxID=2593676 RepID=UPI002257C0A4|nr:MULTISPECIES: GNAT family N-acetyltransferase [unclassified Streptomyces]MCX5056290.1 GNAT family N-acetyltransferase [Streptomyces sp. NBC_00452]MCX5246810.1 GNAT family N-acetyltransferase [Streptomyces sp. NBC_00201]
MVSADEQHGHSPFPDLYGPGIRLRMWDADSAADVATWWRGLTDPEFRRWNTPLRLVEDLADARESLRTKVLAAAEGSTASYCVTDAASGAALGHIGVNAINRVLSVARVGYWVLPEARGQGIATRALAVASHWALTELGLHRLELDHALGHEASCRIAERCGFRYEGTLRGAMFEAGRHDAFRDMHLHGRLATDPERDPEIAWDRASGGSGASGASGTSGTSVVSGASGTSGTSGTSDVSGTS